jgi:hypothetical protein
LWRWQPYSSSFSSTSGVGADRVSSAIACFQKLGTSREEQVSVPTGGQHPNVIQLSAQKCLLICVLSCCSYLISQSSEGSAQRVPFCTLSRQPDKYNGSLVTLQVIVKSFRHGTSISDPSCPKQGIGLIASQSADQTTSVSHFYQFLQQHRLSRIPIFATITGRLVADSDSGFVKRDVVFKLESVSGVSEGDQTGKQ